MRNGLACSGEGGVSVIIPALNEEQHIGGLLEDLAAQSRLPEEVLVVDAGSSDGTVNKVRSFDFPKLLAGEPPVARGRNLGAGNAREDLLLFLDADVRLSDDFLEEFIKGFRERNLDLACPTYTPLDSTPTVKYLHRALNGLLRTLERVIPAGGGACIAVRREVFERSAGFDEALKFEDVEFVRRVARTDRFGFVNHEVFVSDRRYTEQGVVRMAARYALLSLLIALGFFRLANYIPGSEPGNRS